MKLKMQFPGMLATFPVLSNPIRSVAAVLAWSISIIAEGSSGQHQ